MMELFHNMYFSHSRKKSTGGMNELKIMAVFI